jgi:hypothetical protein
MEIKGNDPEYKVTQTIKSVFSPKTSRLIRPLLQGPLRAWKVEELAAKVGVSFGLVSRVRKALLKEEWAEERADGIVVTQPDEILRKWLSKRLCHPVEDVFGELEATALEGGPDP